MVYKNKLILRAEAKLKHLMRKEQDPSIVKDIRQVQISLKDRELKMLEKIDEVRATEFPIATRRNTKVT